MAFVTKFLRGLIEKWWAKMSCAAFTILSFVLAFRPDANYWTIRGTFFLAVVFGMISSYQVWKDQHDRAERAELALSQLLKSPPINSDDWKKIGAEIEGCPRIQATYQYASNDDREGRWNLGESARTSICQEWMRRAGAMLLESSKVSKDVDENVKGISDDFVRWCNYLKSKGHFGNQHVVIEMNTDGTETHITVGLIQEINLISARVCNELAAKEFKPQP